MDEERINQLLEAFNTMDKDAKAKLTNTYKITMALIGAQIEAIENARKATKEIENQRKEIVDEISRYGENAILWDSEKRDEQRKRLEEKTEEYGKVKEKEEEATKKAVETINGHVDNLKLNIKRQKEQITATIPTISEDEKSIKLYYQEKMIEVEDVAEYEELESERDEKLGALKKLNDERTDKLNKLEELNELEDAIDSIKGYIEKKVEVNFKEAPAQSTPEKTTPAQSAPEKTAPKTPERGNTEKIKFNIAEKKTYGAAEDEKSEEEDSIYKLIKPSKEVPHTEENKTTEKISKLTYFNVKRDVKGVTIDGNFISYEEIDKTYDGLSEEQQEELDSNIPDVTIILASLALEKKEPEFDGKSFGEEYASLVLGDRDEKGKRTSKMDLTYDLKIRFRDLFKKESRRELKYLRDAAHEARGYAKVEARGINKLILNRRAHKATMAEKFPGKEEPKKIAEASKKEEFAKSIDARAAIVKKRATRERTGVKNVSKEKEMADEIAKNVASEIEKEEER